MKDELKNILQKSTQAKPNADFADTLMAKIEMAELKKSELKIKSKSRIRLIMLSFIAVFFVLLITKFNGLLSMSIDEYLPHFTQILSMLTFVSIGFGLLYEFDNLLKQRRLEKM